MPVRKSEAVWQGTLKEGSGRMRLASGLYEGPYTFSSRFEEAAGTNPEELIGAAHAGCFSMFLAALLSEKGFTPGKIHTTAAVHLGQGPPSPRSSSTAKRPCLGWMTASSRRWPPRPRRPAPSQKRWLPSPR